VPLFQPPPSLWPMSHTSLNVTWTSAEPSTQLRGVARNYSVYLWVTDVSSWQVRDTVTSLQHCKMHSRYNIRSQNKCIGDYTKGAACRRPNCVRKTKKYVLWNAGIIPLLKFCEKLFPHYFTKLAHSVAELCTTLFRQTCGSRKYNK